MSLLPIGEGPLEWNLELRQNSTLIDVGDDGGLLGWYAVSDTWKSMAGKSGQGPMWVSGVASFELLEAGPGVGELTVSAPPYPDAPGASGQRFCPGSGVFLGASGDRHFEVWIDSGGLFTFSPDDDIAALLGEDFTASAGDRMYFHFRYPLTPLEFA